MSYVTTTDMLRDAENRQYAVGAFNAENLEMIQAIIAAAEEAHSPVIIQTTSGTLQYIEPAAVAAVVSRLARDAGVPIALHLDHGNGCEIVNRCIQEGYTSVMIDGSKLPYEENISVTKRTVELANGVPVEAELGTVGGKEDGVAAQTQYTDPYQAKEFVSRTGITSFAPAIGTAHGIYHQQPKLDLKRLQEIRAMVAVPLVLHGTSGLTDDMVKQCIRYGISKVNYATDLRVTFTQAVRKALGGKPEAYDPKYYLGAAREAVKNRVIELMHVCQSEGKAS